MPERSRYSAPKYRQEALFLRDLAQLAKSAEARQELLTLAIAYERLAERRKASQRTQNGEFSKAECTDSVRPYSSH